MFKYEVPRNVRAVRQFLGLTFKAWIWTLSSMMIIAPIVYLISMNPFFPIISILLVYFFMKVNFAVDEKTGEYKIQAILSHYGNQTKNRKTLSVRWGANEFHDKQTVRTIIKSK